MKTPPLRRASPLDVGSVRDLVRAAYAKWVPLIGREPRPMTASYEHAVVDHIIDLYEEGNRPVALIEMIPEGSCLLIENVAVLPEHQHKGIGESLLQHAETLARSLGLAELRLYTNAAFGANIAFYARRGYEEFQREPLAAGGELVHMKKAIAP